MRVSKRLLMVASLLLSFGAGSGWAAGKEMTVYHSPTCMCCGKWIEYMKKSGFKINDVVTEDVDSYKRKLGVPPQLASCHTASIDSHVVEGHVPVEDINRLLKTKSSKIVGIAAPGMPMGSPGMEMGGRKDSYKIMSFDRDGKIEVFAEH